MTQDDFEAMIEVVLQSALAEASSAKPAQIGGRKIPPRQRNAFGLLGFLAQPRAKSPTLPAPSSEFLPPCF